MVSYCETARSGSSLSPTLRSSEINHDDMFTIHMIRYGVTLQYIHIHTSSLCLYGFNPVSFSGLNFFGGLHPISLVNSLLKNQKSEAPPLRFR